MKLLKKINNNFVLAKDSDGEVVIVEGKGIGFNKMPCQLTDLSAITRTYYGMNETSIDLIRSLDPKILNISNQIYESLLKSTTKEMSSNFPFILADHIEFMIERQQKGIEVNLPVFYEIEHFYPDELRFAKYAMKMIEKAFSMRFPKQEVSGLAMTIINAEKNLNLSVETNEQIINRCVEVIEKQMKVHIDRESFNYSRFIYHMRYLLRRTDCHTEVSEDNLKLYQTVQNRLPEYVPCVNELEIVFHEHGMNLNEEEKLYLLLHLNRLCD